MKIELDDDFIKDLFEERVKLTPFEESTVCHALKKLFKDKGHYDICTVRDIIKILKIIPNEDDFSPLAAMHCVDYSAMTPEFRRELKRKTLELLQIDLSALERSNQLLIESVVVETPKRSFLNFFLSK